MGLTLTRAILVARVAEATTIIGSTITIDGKFTSQEDVSVHGTVQGHIETSAGLFVEEGGTVEAEVVTHNIDVRGKVVGNVTASDRFEVHPGCSVTGDVRAPRVVLADGGKYKGRIDMDKTPAKLEAPAPDEHDQPPAPVMSVRCIGQIRSGSIRP
jgi:cytoskeletal protein CcmA (bactofilin family)